MKKFTTVYISLLSLCILLSSCSTQSSVDGLWQDTKAAGTIEFKTNGDVIIVDNMSATVTGTYEVKDDDAIIFELTATDILRDSIQPIEKTVVTAIIIKLNDEELQLRFVGASRIEHYERAH